MSIASNLPDRESGRSQRSRYDSIVVMNRLHDPDMIDLGSIGGVWDIYKIAEEHLSDAELYLLSATHFYPHANKKSVRTLASEFECTEKTIQSYIESAKKIVSTRLKESGSPFVGHPLMRVRVYPLTDGCDSVLPCAPIAQEITSETLVSESVDRMASILFDTDTYFAVTSYYLRGADTRLSAAQISQALGITASGARQKIHEARNVLKQACDYQMQKSRFLAHPMFTREDPHFAVRRLPDLDQDRFLTLEGASTQALFKAASGIEARYRIPLLRTHFYTASEKPSLKQLGADLRLAPSVVEEYILRGRAELKRIVSERMPLLEDHPLLRSRRRYPTEYENKRSYECLERPIISRLSEHDQKRLKWANILLNSQQYHVFEWALAVQATGVKQAFMKNEELRGWANYSALSVAIRTAKELCDDAIRIDQKFMEEQARKAAPQFEVVTPK